jgi:glycosyltransferase involved in cell wall biosynthesis
MVSIVIPYHNADRELFLLCMQSVFAQTYQNFEVVIVNDGSSKEYTSTLEEVKNTDRRIRVISQECLGASNARNRGVAEAKGEYIAFIDADDMVLPRYLEESLQTIENYGADLVAGGVRVVFRLQDMLSDFKKESEKLTKDEIQVFEGKEIRDFKMNLTSSRKLIKYPEGNVDRGPVARLLRREFAAACPFCDDLIMWEDLVWNLELLDKCKKVCIVTKTWYLYYQNQESQIHQYRPNVVSEVEKSMTYIEKLFDLDTEDEFETFGDYVYDNLRRIYRLYFSRKECLLTKKERRKEYKRIYTSEPWTFFGSDRYYKRTDGKNKLMSFFYRRRLFFSVFGMKEKIKNHKAV